MDTDTRNAVIWSGITSDANYFGRFARDLNLCNDPYLSSTMALCMVPHLSLAMYESLQKLKKLSPEISTVFSEDALSISARSRHSLKLFEDTKRGIEGQLSYFRDDVLAAHSERFLNNTWLPLARHFETDLGLNFYAGRLISTTHAATFHLGFDTNRLLAPNSGPYISSVFEEYGSFFGALGANLEGQGEQTFIRSLQVAALAKPRDVRAKSYYRQIFNGRDTPEINALLTTFRAMLNFAELVMEAGINRQHLDYTAFKVGYLSVYQVLRSVRLLLDDSAYPLTTRSERIARSISCSPSAQVITRRSSRPFRNTIMHYNLPFQIDVDRVDLSKSFFGLIPIYFPEFDDGAFVELVRECGASTAAAFDEWAEGIQD
ncbi:hypothetical protein [Streptomyces sp. NPDC058579]|uniref:hypothetical protein n=1 Tax=Streptomyces sp. NPDC058579 TaxID=3346548 RepID=UPI00365AD4D3